MLDCWLMADIHRLLGQRQWKLPLTGAGGGIRVCAQYTSFFGRTSALNVAHQAAFQKLICNLVTEGVWAKLDVMYVFATNSSGNALLNLVSSSFTATVVGAPTFAADGGYTGTDAFPAVNYLDTGFNASTAGGNFVLNSAHLSCWSNTNFTTVNGGSCIGIRGSGTTDWAFIEPHDSSQLLQISTINNAAGTGVTNANSTGHYLANRTSSALNSGYKNAASVQAANLTSGAVANGNMFVLANNKVGTGPINGGAYQIMAATIGGGLTAGDITNLCHELNTYLNTIAGVASGAC